MLSPLAGKLKKVYLSNNAFSGPLDCGLVAPGLELLWLDTNLLEVCVLAAAVCVSGCTLCKLAAGGAGARELLWLDTNLLEVCILAAAVCISWYM